jgi:hypothetical protein
MVLTFQRLEWHLSCDDVPNGRLLLGVEIPAHASAKANQIGIDVSLEKRFIVPVPHCCSSRLFVFGVFPIQIWNKNPENRLEANCG